MILIIWRYLYVSTLIMLFPKTLILFVALKYFIKTLIMLIILFGAVEYFYVFFYFFPTFGRHIIKTLGVEE